MCFQSDYNWFSTIPDGTATNLPLLPSGLQLILHWGRLDTQAFQSHSQYSEAVVLNNSRWHSNKPAPIAIWVATHSALGETRHPSLSISLSVFWSCGHWSWHSREDVLKLKGWLVDRCGQGYFRFLHSAHNWFYSHVCSCWFHIGGEQTPEPLNLILCIWRLWKEAFKLSHLRSQLNSSHSRWHSTKSPPFPSGFPLIPHWGRSDSQAFESHSQDFGPV